MLQIIEEVPWETSLGQLALCTCIRHMEPNTDRSSADKDAYNALHENTSFEDIAESHGDPREPQPVCVSQLHLNTAFECRMQSYAIVRCPRSPAFFVRSGPMQPWCMFCLSVNNQNLKRSQGSCKQVHITTAVTCQLSMEFGPS